MSEQIYASVPIDPRVEKVVQIILDAGWRSGEESYDYGYGGEVTAYYGDLDTWEVRPVAEAIVAALNAPSEVTP